MVEKIIEESLRSYEAFGVKKLENGSRLIAEAKYVAPMAYVHSVLHSPNNVLRQIEQEFETEIKGGLKEFYTKYNGLKLFHTAFNVYGVRLNNSRSVNAAQGEPFCIITENSGSNHYLDEGLLCIGGYSWDGSKVLYNLQTEEVYLRHKNMGSINIRVWHTFENLINEEISRLREIHTDEGKLVPYQPSVPVGGYEELYKRLTDEKYEKYFYWYRETLIYLEDKRIDLDTYIDLLKSS